MPKLKLFSKTESWLMVVGACAKSPSFIDRLRFDRTIVDSAEIFLMDSEAVSFGASNKLTNGKTSWPEGVKVIYHLTQIMPDPQITNLPH